MIRPLPLLVETTYALDSMATRIEKAQVAKTTTNNASLIRLLYKEIRDLEKKLKFVNTQAYIAKMREGLEADPKKFVAQARFFDADYMEELAVVHKSLPKLWARELLEHSATLGVPPIKSIWLTQAKT